MPRVLLEFVIDSKGNLKAFSQAGKELTGVGKGAQKAKTGMDHLKAATGLVIGAFVALRAAQKAVDFVKMGAATQRQAAALDNLGRAAGTSGDAITKAIQEASDHTIDRMTAMSAASKAMILDVAESPEQFARLTKAATTLGRAMGRNAAQSIDDFVVAAGRQSRMIADNLGLMVSAESANKRYAASLGISSDALTDAQKKQAFLTEMLRQAEIKMAALGDTTLDAMGKMEQASAGWTDTKNALASLAASIANATGALDKTASWARDTAAATDAIERRGFSIESWAEAVDVYVTTLDRTKAIQTFTGEIEKSEEAIEAQATDIERWGHTLKETGEIARYAATTDLPNLTEAIEETRSKVTHLSTAEKLLLADEEAWQSSMGDTKRHMLSIIPQSEAMKTAIDAQRTATNLATTAQLGLNETLKDASSIQIAQVAFGMLKEELDKGTISTAQYTVAVNETQLAFGLADEKSIALTTGIYNLVGSLAEGKTSADRFNEGLAQTVIDAEHAKTATDKFADSIRKIPDRTVRIKTIRTTVDETHPEMEVVVTPIDYGGVVVPGGEVPGLQYGGAASGLTFVGERGMELVDLPTGSHVYSATQTRSMLGGGPSAARPSSGPHRPPGGRHPALPEVSDMPIAEGSLIPLPGSGIGGWGDRPSAAGALRGTGAGGGNTYYNTFNFGPGSIRSDEDIYNLARRIHELQTDQGSHENYEV